MAYSFQTQSHMCVRLTGMTGYEYEPDLDDDGKSHMCVRLTGMTGQMNKDKRCSYWDEASLATGYEECVGSTAPCPSHESG
jgi:hypothetical protein